jgi:sterol desaturase/sphingolipid hydroxylase (fatty acid hydroxylase superfamily)
METALGRYSKEILAFLALLILLEIIWNWRNEKHVYQLKETLANFAILAGFQLSKFLFGAYQLTILGFAVNLAFFELPKSQWMIIPCFVVVDFVYYWYHRVSHVWKPMWAFHLVHHSSPLMNLTTSYRLNWFSAIVSPLFFVPLALMGFSPDHIVLSFALNLLYQFFLHTEFIGKLGFLEGNINTPSAHRVHHGANEIYIDKNFGGVLMLWDRLFGTYVDETEKVKYGITTGFVSHNPFVLVLHGFKDLFTNKMKYKG